MKNQIVLATTILFIPIFTAQAQVCTPQTLEYSACPLPLLTLKPTGCLSSGCAARILK
jgi:hypothetical protein